MNLSVMGLDMPGQLPFIQQPTSGVANPSVTQPQPVQQMQQSTQVPAAKRRRTASAVVSNCCRTCRLRKVKCDGNPGDGGPCANCARLELACPFMSGPSVPGPPDKIARVKPSSSHTEAGTIRKRAQRACSQCHTQKTKCSGDLPRCKRCETAGLNCEYLPPKRKFANEGTFDPPTAAALCALTTFFVNPDFNSSQEFGMKCCDEVEFYIFRNLHKFSERVLLPYALILCFNFLNGSFAKVWQCFGLATRFMTGLQLNWEVSSRNKTFQQQELGRRLAWQFFVMDRLLAGGYEEYISCRADIMKIRLPCEESAFWENKPILAERLTDKNAKAQGVGFHGLTVRLTDLIHRIQCWTKRLSSKTTLEPSKVMEDINNFQNELTRFHLCIPDDIRLSDQSIAKYIASPEKVGYVYLHTHLSVGHIDLYRFALPGIIDPKKNDIVQRLPKDFVERSKKQAIAHALCSGRFCIAIQKEAEKHPYTGKGPVAGDCTIPHMATQTLRVLLLAIQHRIYDNLTQDTTAPLWRFEDPDEKYIRRLIEDGLFKVSEPWKHILMTCYQAHTNNMAMFEEFNKTQKFADQKGTVGFVGSKAPSGDSRLPGPHYILENASFGVVEQEKRTRAGDAATADRWFKGPQQEKASSPALMPTPGDFDATYGPPGLPLLLAVGRDATAEHSTGQPMPEHNIYDMPRETTMPTQDKAWLAPGYSDSVNDQYLGASGASGAGGPGSLPMMQQMDAPELAMVFPPPQAGQQLPNKSRTTNVSEQYVPPQQGVFMNGYPAGYGDGGASSGYMQQPPNFG
ncbi:putative transcriptional regulatory protein-like protein [Emericellopsis cladophorae]|uniref:Transcriptional regulatory protein-like protein n=1 Tax=Emericellopsis cladophorae TaxID=2686198 RepID=A0A9P9Y5H8_9HYPO|nr:putative transcriptional regulatory protein-like protein [Emericellopsis cladophorae]KAI6783882.1 putative transcriptional regulatory protein-like protein [Emericellopsis cladophorae]